MATAVFTPCYGAIGLVRDCGDKILKVTFDGGTVDGIMTGMSLELSGNYQFLHTVNDFIYFYAFGDRIGTLAVSGVSFINACTTGGANRVAPKSLIDLYNWYQTKRAVKNSATPIKIQIVDNDKTASFSGFLTGMRADISDNGMGFIGNWSLRFEVLPQE